MCDPAFRRVSRALVEEIMGEANLSAQEAQAHAHARLSRPDADPGGSGRDQGPPGEGAGAAYRLTWRIRDRATFESFASGRRLRRGPLSLAVLRAVDPVPPRLAYAVGRRVGPAVTRNRVRRRLRAAVERHRSRLEPGCAYLLGASPAAARASFDQLEAAVGELLTAASS
jgi:ribonuclease P protein component